MSAAHPCTFYTFKSTKILPCILTSDIFETIVRDIEGLITTRLLEFQLHAHYVDNGSLSGLCGCVASGGNTLSSDSLQLFCKPT